MKKLLLILMALLPMLAYAGSNNATESEVSTDYTNLLEVGKEWKYTMVMVQGLSYPDLKPEKRREYLRTLKIDDKTNIDGTEYFVLNSYADVTEEEPLNNVLLREDPDAKKVWLVVDDNDILYLQHYYYGGGLWDEIIDNDGKVVKLLYDFNDEMPSLTTFDAEYKGEATLETPQGTIEVAEYSNPFVSFYISNSLGALSTPNDSEAPFDLFGYYIQSVMSFPCDQYFPYLYEVRDAEGNILYSNANYQPGWTNKYTSKASVISEDSVKVQGSKIEVESISSCDALLYNSLGQLVHKAHINGSGTIDASRLPSGVYILDISGKTYKIAL